MRCPNCGHPEDRVIDSRSTKEGRAIRRRRECIGCGHRYTTYEYVENASVVVVKKDGKREPWSREKMVAGIARACEAPILGQIGYRGSDRNRGQRQASRDLETNREMAMAEAAERMSGTCASPRSTVT
jgi:hypothetical protein